MRLALPKLLYLRSDELLFVILLGILATILGYQFGLGNQTEHLPLVLRLLDPAYLQNDFFVDSAIEFGPRFYYVHLLAFLAQWFSLPFVVLSLALVVNVSLAALSFLAVRDLLQGDRLAGFIAAILVVSVSSFPLGLVTDIRFIDFQPASLAIPGCLAALWAGLRGKAVLAACLAGVSCLPHPLYGVETGAIAIGTALCVGLVEPTFPPSKARLVSVVIQFLTATTILIAIALIFWALPKAGHSSEPLTTYELISILAYFRAPHHYVPSLFPIEHYIAFVFFLAAVAVCWLRWRATQSNRTSTFKFLVPPSVVILACGAGYLFTEVWPIRAAVVAQPFRMLYLVKWLGFLFLGWQISSWIRRSHSASFAWIALLGSGAAQTIIAFLSLAAERLDHYLRQAIPVFPRFLVPITLLAASLVLLGRAGKIEETALVVIAMGLALPLSDLAIRPRRRFLPVVLAVLLIVAAGVNRSTHTLGWKFFDPIITWEDHRGDDAEVARWALHNTAEGDIFLIPPDMGTFRQMARRAVIVDFESLPFDGEAMREWRKRIHNCYGEVSTSGFQANQDLVKNYRQISDEELEQISLQYNPAYAVLFDDTDTSRPVLYRNSTYKIIATAIPTSKSHYQN